MSIPFTSPYAASKFAVRGWMDALRLELGPQGVVAVLIEPGAVATPMWDKGNAAVEVHIEGLDSAQRDRYKVQIAGGRKAAAMAERHAISPERCAKVIERALSAPRPRGRYLVGPDAYLQAAISVLPTRALDSLTRLAVRQPRRERSARRG
jgi:NAD(P)-dependent dehydrogenase (short-subunit alcohol dehydrogenase family)